MSEGKENMKKKPSSVDEEKLCALWSIAALLAWNNGIHWLAILFAIKAFLDFVCSIVAAIRGMKEEANS